MNNLTPCIILSYLSGTWVHITGYWVKGTNLSNCNLGHKWVAIPSSSYNKTIFTWGKRAPIDPNGYVSIWHEDWKESGNPIQSKLVNHHRLYMAFQKLSMKKSIPTHLEVSSSPTCFASVSSTFRVEAWVGSLGCSCHYSLRVWTLCDQRLLSLNLNKLTHWDWLGQWK